MSKGTVIYYGGFVLPCENAAANRVRANGKIFCELGYRTVFLGTNYGEQNELLHKLENYENLYSQKQAESVSQWAKHLVSTRNIDELIKKYPDTKAVVLYNMPFVTTVIFKNHLKNKGISLYYDCTEWTGFTEGSIVKKVFKKADEFFVSRFIHKVAQKVICVSSTMEKAYGKKNTLVIPPLVDINDDIWHQPTVSHTGYEFLFAGVPDGNKERIDKVVSAFCTAEIKDATLRIIGITKDDFSKIYPDCKIPEDKEKLITFMGRLSHKETIQYVRSADCYVFIRENDKRNNAGFPTKFAECFTCNMGVIATNVSDIPYYAESNKKSIVLDNTRVAALSKAMEECVRKGVTQTGDLNRTFHYEEYIEKVRAFIEIN